MDNKSKHCSRLKTRNSKRDFSALMPSMTAIFIFRRAGISHKNGLFFAPRSWRKKLRPFFCSARLPIKALRFSPKTVQKDVDISVYNRAMAALAYPFTIDQFLTKKAIEASHPRHDRADSVPIATTGNHHVKYLQESMNTTDCVYTVAV